MGVALARHVAWVLGAPPMRPPRESGHVSGSIAESVEAGGWSSSEGRLGARRHASGALLARFSLRSLLPHAAEERPEGPRAMRAGASCAEVGGRALAGARASAWPYQPERSAAAAAGTTSGRPGHVEDTLRRSLSSRHDVSVRVTARRPPPDCFQGAEQE